MGLGALLLHIPSLIASPIFNCIDDHGAFTANVEELKWRLLVLNAKTYDIGRMAQAEVSTEKMLRLEVEIWFEDVKRINTEVQALLATAGRVKWHKRASLGKDVRRKISMVVDTIYQRGSFPGGLVVDRPTRGITIPTENLNLESAVSTSAVSTKEEIQQYLMDDQVRMVGVYGIGGVGKTTIIVLPDNLQNLLIHRCKNMRSLNKIALQEKATQLRWCSIWDCEEMKSVFDFDSSDFDSSSSISSLPVLDKLEFLYLYLLPRLDVLVRVEGEPTQPHIFSNLKTLLVSKCSGMRQLFPLELLQTLQNLEEIGVGECEQMEQIIASSSDSNVSSDEFPFPKLRELKLFNLPQLKSICNDGGVLVCNSIEVIEILHCPKLEGIPLQLAQLDEVELSPPPRLRKICIEKDSKWWESLEWKDPRAKPLLQSFLQYND